MSRDIQGVLQKNLDSPKELADDLAGFSATPEGEAPARDLAGRLSDVLPGRKMTGPETERLAHSLWVALTARQLSEDQAAAIGTEVQTMLVAAGVPEPDAQSVAAQLGEAQKTITARQRRWYELF